MTAASFARSNIYQKNMTFMSSVLENVPMNMLARIIFIGIRYLDRRLLFFRILYTLLNRFIIIPFFPRLHPAYKIAVECDCDIYHVNNWDAFPMGARAAKNNNSKVVLDLHESYSSWYWGLSSGMVKYVLKKYSGDVAFSTTVVDALAQQHRKLGY
jgi:hypothetical protein